MNWDILGVRVMGFCWKKQSPWGKALLWEMGVGTDASLHHSDPEMLEWMVFTPRFFLMRSLGGIKARQAKARKKPRYVTIIFPQRAGENNS